MNGRLLALALLAGLAAACDGSEPLRRDCLARVWIPASEGEARVVGSWNGWAEPGVASEPYDAVWRLARFELPAGEHGYLIARAGERIIDVNNPLTTYADETEVSLLLVSDCSRPALMWERAQGSATGDISLQGTFLAGADGEPLDPLSVSAQTRSGHALEVTRADPETGIIEAHAAGLARGKHTVSLGAADEAGVATDLARATAWVAPAHADWRDGVLYQIMIDRFRSNGGASLATPASPGGRAGGTLDGVRAELESGALSELGVTAIWLSPIYVNPDVPRAGNDGRSYEAYHGYWPLESRAVDERLGGAAAMQAVVHAAHERGIRVLLDLVPNHVYEDNPRHLEHQGDGWFTPACVCGQTACPWGTHLQTCWFTPYLPDIRFQHPSAMQTTVADSLWWAHEFDLDGVRVDAVPMMPRAATRRIAHGLRTSTFPPSETFLVGEVYTGPGTWGLQEMRYHLGSAGFNSLFDFPLMWALQDAIAAGTGSFAAVEDTLRQQEETFAGSGAVLGRMLDNHDTARFVSVAYGDAGGDPWDAPAEQPSTAEPYTRVRLGLAVVFTLPGMPVIFQGDEVAIAGAGDPDCRRVLPAEEALSAEQRAVRDWTRELARLRSCSPSLRQGDRSAFAIQSRSYGYVRGSDEAHPVIVLMSTSATATNVAIPAAAATPGTYRDVTTGEEWVLSEADLDVALEPLSVRILMHSDDPCLL